MLTRAQWARIILIGVLMAIGTLGVRVYYDNKTRVGHDCGSHSINDRLRRCPTCSRVSAPAMKPPRPSTAISSPTRSRCACTGFRHLFIFLPTELGFLQRASRYRRANLRSVDGLHSRGGIPLLVDEVIKFFLRRSRSAPPGRTGSDAATPPDAGAGLTK